MLVRKPDPERTGADVITPQIAKPAAQAGQRILSANARTTLDGSYTIRDIPPGDYFVVAMLAAYESLGTFRWVERLWCFQRLPKLC
jgi:hypothetical protein